MSDYKGGEIQPQEEGRTSDIEPMSLGWAVLIVMLLVWAIKTIRNNKAGDYDKDSAMVVLLLAGVILAFVAAGNLFGWWGVTGLAGAIWYWFSNKKAPPRP